MKIEQTLKLSKLLAKLGENELSNKINEISIKRAASKSLANVIKWKFLNRNLKTEFKKLYDLLGTYVYWPAPPARPSSESLGSSGVKAVMAIKKWLEYVDDIQADLIDENPNKTEYTPELIGESGTWQEVFQEVFQPLEEKIGKVGKYQSIKNALLTIFNNMKQLISPAQTELTEYFK